ncbi:MAG: helicase-related protein, partial [Armatimonadetes bacterium]|nr:helicase-related protein [Armatimonadota bacterium]
YIADIKAGKMTAKQLAERAKWLRDLFDEQTADEESLNDGWEANERAEDNILGSVIARSIVDLEAEAVKLESLIKLAEGVLEKGDESKFAKLREVIQDPKYKDEKLIIFTEHRDTLTYLVNRLEGLGYTGKVAKIHGGMEYQERQEQVDFFRKPASQGGATYLVATDAAGEGINLQFCWLMVNYDVPWNPARLEQRMGRIHRYGQKHDPVIIINIVAGKTREGRVIKILLEKLERIRRELSSDKVFDVVGRIFEGVSIKSYIERALTEEGAESAAHEIDERLTKERVKQVQDEEKRLYGCLGDVEAQLPRIREEIERETYRRLMPGYVRRFLETSLPLVGAKIDGSPGDDAFTIKEIEPKALDPFLPLMEKYPEGVRTRFTVNKPDPSSDYVFLHVGEPFFDAYREHICTRFAQDALRGAVFVDPTATEPYLFHLVLVTVVRKADPSMKAFSGTQTLEYRLVGLKQDAKGGVQECPVEHLLILKGGSGITHSSARLAADAANLTEVAKAYAFESVAKRAAERQRAALLESLAEREEYVRRGYDYECAELARARSATYKKMREGDPAAAARLESIRKRQAAIDKHKDEALAVIRREPDLIAPGEVTFLAHALVVPAPASKDLERYDAEIESIAMSVARAHEEALGARVIDVSNSGLAAAAGLSEYPGFDLLSQRSDGTKLCIEVKGRARIGEIELSENEWAKACNLRDQYWLYVVYDCATSYPRLLRVQDPFGKLLVKSLGGVKISENEIFGAAEDG